MSVQQSPDQSEATRRRLVVIHSLQDLLSQPEQRQALELWDQSFSQSRAFAVVSFVTKLDEKLGLGARTAAVQRSLTERMFLREDELGARAASSAPAPGCAAGTGGAAAPRAAKAPPTSPASVVFSTLLDGVIRRMERRMDGSMAALVRFLKRILAGSALSLEARGIFSAWCDSSLVGSRLDLANSADMKAVMHAIYLFACDSFGPSITDRLFSNAVREAEELPESSKFSPRNLF